MVAFVKHSPLLRDGHWLGVSSWVVHQQEKKALPSGERFWVREI